MEIVACVVCDAPAPEEHFANTWERTRKRYPCCSPACAERFDPDLHWIPARFPEPATDEDVARLSRVARRRIADGDRPDVLVRELLLAGVPPARVRGLIIELGSRADRDQAATRRANRAAAVLSIFSALGGWMLFWRHRRRDASRLADEAEASAAYDAVERWQRATGATPDPNDPAPLPRAALRDR